MEVPHFQIIDMIDYCKLGHRKLGCKGVDWIHLTLGRVEWLCYDNGIKPARKFFTSWEIQA
jgi:hypothetical protein